MWARAPHSCRSNPQLVSVNAEVAPVFRCPAPRFRRSPSCRHFKSGIPGKVIRPVAHPSEGRPSAGSYPFVPEVSGESRSPLHQSQELTGLGRTSLLDGYSCMRFESCWGLATRIATVPVSRRLTLMITNIWALSILSSFQHERFLT